MKFTKAELLKIYVAMSFSFDRALEIDSFPTDQFQDLMDKVRNALIK